MKTGPLQLLSLCFVLLLAAISFSADHDSQTATARSLFDRNVAVRMRDGVVLRADVLRPSDGGKFPTLVYRTPYGKDAAQEEYTTFRRALERGYAVVIVDVRGRYHSAGEFRPYENEGRDGYDTIEWAAAQPWSNGAVGTFGLSYPGAVQWLAAVESPPHLKAMVPAMTFSTAQNFFYAGGTWDLSWIEWIWDNLAWDVRVKKNLPGPRTEQEALGAWKDMGTKMLETLPLNAVEPLRQVAPYYNDWLKHPAEDPWWDWSELRNKYGRTQAAVLNLSAWYDDNYGPEGATTNFAGLLKARAGERDPRTHLLLGPWVHGVASTGKTKSGEREFGTPAIIDYDDVVLRWMDHYLKGIDNGVEREKPVRYFVMGRNEWREAEAWPPAGQKMTFRLGSAKTGERIGTLAVQAVESRVGFSQFSSDPANPVMNEYASSGAHDYRKLADRDDVLTFDSAMLDSGAYVRLLRLSGLRSVGAVARCRAGWNGIQSDESGTGCCAGELSRYVARASMASAGSRVSDLAAEFDYQQCVFKGTSDAGAGLREFRAELCSKLADREVRDHECGDEEGADSDL
ncbi:MAG: hypothetical protein DMG80_14820 [Acidobacteria bacterium]|nr:MAG: hypothetical protein DMG80_14820 [Acidobacteriota bacterium]